MGVPGPISSSNKHETPVGGTLRPDSLCCSGEPPGPSLHASNVQPSPVRSCSGPGPAGQNPPPPSRKPKTLARDSRLAKAREILHPPAHGPVLDGRFFRGMGGSLRPRSDLERKVDRAAKRAPYQRLGAAHHLNGCKAPRRAKRSPSVMVRQSDRHKCHPQGGFEVPGPARPRVRSSRGMRGQVPSPVPKAYKGSSQCSGRRVVEGGGSSRRVGSPKGSVRSSAKGARQTPSDRSVRFPPQQQATAILRSVSLPSGYGRGCPGSGLEPVLANLPLPSSQPVQRGSQLPSSVQRGRSDDPRVRSYLPPSVPEEVPREGNSLNSARAGSAWSSGEGYRKVTSLSRVEFLRSVYQRSYDKEVVDALLNHLAASSLRQYESSWKRFQEWLVEQG